MQEDFQGDIDEVRLKEIIEEGKFDFNGWTSLVTEVESSFHDDVEKICLVYDSFLSEFPLCYGYWRKYANHLKRLSTVDKVVEIFERAVDSATYSVNVWDDYCSFSISAFEDPNDIRRLFKRAMSFVGKDYLCHTLWDKYITFEFSQQQWGSLAQVYIQILKFPSKKLHHFYERFKKLTAAWKEEFECLSVSSPDLQLDSCLDNEVPEEFTLNEITSIIEDLMDLSVGSTGSKALQKYISIGKQLYEEACQLDEKIQSFESHIRRPYFHPKPLDAGQLDNWHDYLNFVEMHGDFDWAVKLYERCLIPCASYPEFWMRYVDFMESKGGREISDFALARATQTFLKTLPVIHLFSARYKEKLRDISGAQNAFLQYDALADSTFVKGVIMKANMEKRMGNYLEASGIYREAIEVTAAKNNLNDLPLLYLHFSRLRYMVNNNKDSAREILVDGIKRVPHCKLLVEELIRFAIAHGETRQIQAIYAIVNDSISLRSESSQGLDVKDAEDIACLYLEYVDLCGTVDEVKGAWNWHMKLFPKSMRSTSYEFPETGRKPLRLVTARRQENLAPSLHQPCGDSSSGIPTNLSSVDENMERCENGDIQPDRSAMDELSDQKRSSPGNHEIVSDQSKVDLLRCGEIKEGLQNETQDVCPEVLENPHEDANNGMHDACPEVIQKPQEGVADTNNLSLDLVIRKGIEASQTSKECLEETNDKEEHGFQLEKDFRPNIVSVERLSLNDQDNRSMDSLSASTHEREASQEARFSNEVVVKSEPLQETSMSSGTRFDARQNTDRAQCDPSTSTGWAYDSSQIHVVTGSPSLASHQKLQRNESPPSQREKLISSSSDRNQRNNVDRPHRETQQGFQGHSHKNLHQREQQSPHQPYPQAEAATQMPVSQGYPSTAMWSYAQNAYSAPYANMKDAQVSSMQNMQQQSYDPSQASYPSQPTAYPQAQMPTYPMQMNEQAGAMQGNQEYNQMWQYYYYQQQYLWQQQQLLNMQQQNQDPQQQQLSQTQQYYLEQQQQLANQQMQLQQFQQQLQFMQQHPYNQQPLQSKQSQQYLQQQQQILEQNHIYMQQHQFQMQNMQQQLTPIQQQPPPLVKQEQEQEERQQKGEDCHMIDPDTERLKKTGAGPRS